MGPTWRDPAMVLTLTWRLVWYHTITSSECVQEVTHYAVIQQHLNVISPSKNEHILGVPVGQYYKLSYLPRVLNLMVKK